MRLFDEETGAEVAELLRWIRWHVGRYGFPPTWRESSEALGLTYARTVAIGRLASRFGLLARRPRSPRAYAVTGRGRAYERRRRVVAGRARVQRGKAPRNTRWQAARPKREKSKLYGLARTVRRSDHARQATR